MADIYLLGDSVIDNGAYVNAGEPDVYAQIKALIPDHAVQMRAVDGDMVSDTIQRLQDEPISVHANVFLSAGGNDALDNIGLLGATERVLIAEALVTLQEVRETFRSMYTSLLDQLMNNRVLVATIYNPSFTSAEAYLQKPAEGALSVFNDVIQQESLKRGFDILDMRALFDDSDDYANPIEPSAKGGAKIAKALEGWVSAGNPGND